ncbi:hypothetical protein [Marinobacterium litorale]|uniref:hypothetical protein n=1 Tax=Marinobacterium litorale TaxID=404770 RepID=UPI000485F567|nr:hypothetical protein [Marinobacterium litorale]
MLETVEVCLCNLERKANHNKLEAKRKGEKYIWYSTHKNKDIKDELSRELESLSSDIKLLKARSSGKGGSGGEWLYDFTLREFDLDGNFVGVPLVAEIELSDSKSSGLLYDFNKLLQSDSSNKVFIFQQKEESGFYDILDRIEPAIKAYDHKVSSNFLISCWITSRYTFKSKRIVIEF